MFTGLVQAVGEVVRVEPVEAGVLLEFDAGPWGTGGDSLGGRGGSVCVSGCCLTLTEDPGEIGGRLRFVAVPETLSLTTLGGLRVGNRVNLEASVTASTLMGGHFVQGHVDGVGRVTLVVRPGDDGSGGEWRVRVEPPASMMRWMTPKGSVCLDGVSLTIAALSPGDRGAGGWIEVALIPETLEKTTLGDRVVGDPINIEGDVLVKSVVHALENYLRGPGIGDHGSGGV